MRAEMRAEMRHTGRAHVAAAWDTNGDGSVSRDEFARAMGTLGLDAPSSAVDGLFCSFDLDSSGEVRADSLLDSSVHVSAHVSVVHVSVVHVSVVHLSAFRRRDGRDAQAAA